MRRMTRVVTLLFALTAPLVLAWWTPRAIGAPRPVTTSLWIPFPDGIVNG